MRRIAYKKQLKRLEPQRVQEFRRKSTSNFLCKLTKAIGQYAQNFTWIFVKFVEAEYLNLGLIGV